MRDQRATSTSTPTLPPINAHVSIHSRLAAPSPHPAPFPAAHPRPTQPTLAASIPPCRFHQSSLLESVVTDGRATFPNARLMSFLVVRWRLIGYKARRRLNISTSGSLSDQKRFTEPSNPVHASRFDNRSSHNHRHKHWLYHHATTRQPRMQSHPTPPHHVPPSPHHVPPRLGGDELSQQQPVSGFGLVIYGGLTGSDPGPGTAGRCDQSGFIRRRSGWTVRTTATAEEWNGGAHGYNGMRGAWQDFRQCVKYQQQARECVALLSNWHAIARLGLRSVTVETLHVSDTTFIFSCSGTEIYHTRKIYKPCASKSSFGIYYIRIQAAGLIIQNSTNHCTLTWKPFSLDWQHEYITFLFICKIFWAHRRSWGDVLRRYAHIYGRPINNC